MGPPTKANQLKLYRITRTTHVSRVKYKKQYKTFADSSYKSQQYWEGKKK
jgi:hypothetical protein